MRLRSHCFLDVFKPFNSLFRILDQEDCICGQKINLIVSAISGVFVFFTSEKDEKSCNNWEGRNKT